jgi:hypothetical protein
VHRVREEPLSSSGLHGDACTAGVRLEDLVLSALASVADGIPARCLVCGEAELAPAGCRDCGSSLE